MAKSSISPTEVRELSRTHNRLLTVGSVLGSLCVIATLAGLLVGAKPLIFRSGSMSPAITTGALGVSVPVQASEIRVGDVLSVENTSGIRVTHRVVRVDINNGIASVTLKGDANGVPDAAPYTLREADRVIFSAPLLGYVVAWLNSSAAVFAGGLFTAYLLYLAFGQRVASRPPTSGDGGTKLGRASAGRKIHRRSRTGRHSGQDKRRIRLLAGTTVASVLALTGSALHTATPSHAAFTDSANAAATLSAVQPEAPDVTCVQHYTNEGLAGSTPTWVEVKWQPSSGVGISPTAYRLTTQKAGSNESAGELLQPVVTVRNYSTGTLTANTVVRIYSRYGTWESIPDAVNLNYTAGLLGGILGAVPAKLQCPTSG
ncbi:signal peptidase I [Arthrobacter sp. NPDC093125]|uniref:signal peptidase I n=1 Tax=Arthrobacter sp. NPDC093125 TaxID=3363944 RepID=UPI0037FE44E3